MRMRTTELFAAQHLDGGFRHFYPSASVIKSLCLSPDSKTPVLPVCVTEDPTGGYFAWWDEKRQSFSMVHHARMLVEMCSPDAFKHAEATGQGKLLQVRVELR